MNLEHPEVEELLGAYALDAVEPDEAAAVERHLATCPRCRAEVAEHREVASMLAMSGAPAPDGVWDRIVEAIDGEELPAALAQPPVLAFPGAGRAGGAVPPPRSTRRRRTLGALAGLVAAAAVVVIALLGVRVADQADTIDDLEQAAPPSDVEALTRAALAATTDPTARAAVLASTAGGGRVDAVVTVEGRGYLIARDVPELAEGRTYQLWGISGEAVVSLGVLGRGIDVVAFSVDQAVGTLALSDEAAPGTTAPSAAPVLQGDLT